MAYLLDSDWVISYLNGDPEAIELIDRLALDGIAISVITYTEIYEGILRASDPLAANQMLDSFLSGIRLLPMTAPVARETARLRLELRQAGRRVNQRALDLPIAATAIRWKFTMVTKNVADYRDIPGISLYSA